MCIRDRLTPITPAQARALGTMVRDRSAQLQAQYGLPAQSIRSISAALRKAIQLDAGVRTLTELPRTLYPVYADFIAMWDDYDVMTSIKKRFETKGCLLYTSRQAAILLRSVRAWA